MYPKDLAKQREKKNKKPVKEKKGGAQQGREEEIKDFFNSHIIMRKDIPDVIFFE
jgi:hypothetical protein